VTVTVLPERLIVEMLTVCTPSVLPVLVLAATEAAV